MCVYVCVCVLREMSFEKNDINFLIPFFFHELKST